MEKSPQKKKKRKLIIFSILKSYKYFLAYIFMILLKFTSLEKTVQDFSYFMLIVNIYNKA
jgi:hypothetical protein